MSDTPSIDPQAQPQPPTKRLNRNALVIAVVSVAGIFWIGAALLVRKSPIAQPQHSVATPTNPDEKAALAQLQQVIENAKRKLGENEQRLSQERQNIASASGYPPSLPPGAFDGQPGQAPFAANPLGRQLTPPGYDAAEAAYPEGAGPRQPAINQTQAALERAMASGLVPAGFNTASGRDLDDSRAPRSRDGVPAMPPMPDFKMPDFKIPEIGQQPTSAEADYLKRKDNFLAREASKGSATALDATPQQAPGRFTLHTGTLIPAILLTGVNSDLPGQATATVRRDVYDSTTGHHLLIPQGSRLIGEYDNRIAYGQKRVLLAWNRLLFPDGTSIDLRGMPGADLAAAAGLSDRVNTHFASVFGHALLLSAISAALQLSQPQQSADGRAPSATQIAAAAVGQELANVTSSLLQRQLSVQPTLEIRPGYLFNVEVTADMLFGRPYSLPLRATAAP
ncbi:MAG: TrbI/VirB10 family protein [Acidobacteriota bacterium]